MKDIVMPKMGMVMTEGTIVEWKKHPGDPVAAGDAVLSIETDKMTRDVESKYDGILTEILYDEEAEVPVGTVIARIDDGAPAATPKAASEPAAETPANTQKMGYAQKLVAKNMLESCRTKAMVTYLAKLDKELLGKAAEKCGASETAVLASAAGKALREYANFRSSVTDDAIEVHECVNIGLTMRISGGLAAPVIRNADEKTPATLTGEIESLKSKASDGALRLEDLEGGVFTITDLAASCVECFTPIVNLNDSASLGIGGECNGVALERNKLVLKKHLKLCLTADHRLIYGEEAAAFLQSVINAVTEFAAE